LLPEPVAVFQHLSILMESRNACFCCVIQDLTSCKNLPQQFKRNNFLFLHLNTPVFILSPQGCQVLKHRISTLRRIGSLSYHTDDQTYENYWRTIRSEKQINMARTICVFVLLLLAFSCKQLSETISDGKADFNGGFEVVSKGLPVNWMLYTNETVETGDFSIMPDTTTFIEGKQSLRFLIRSCSSEGGRYSPGMAKEFEIEPGRKYQVSFWVKNSNTSFRIMAGGVSAHKGGLKTLLQTNEQINDWKEFNFDVPISENYSRMRIEIAVLQPGTFWIDNIRIRK